MTLPSDTQLTCPVLIGRTREIETLAAFIALARSGQGQVALISGEAGIGKSRLVAHVNSAAQAQGFLFLQGHCFPADRSYPYAPLLDLLRAAFTTRVPARNTIDQDRWVAELLQLLPDLALLFPDLVPLPLPPLLPPPRDREQQKRRLFALLTHFLTAQAARQPILLVMEDVHWCDENSLDFLLHLARQCQGQPLFLLCTYRSDEASPRLNSWLAQLDRARLAAEIALTPLAYAEVQTMLQAIFAAPHPVSSGLLRSVYTLTEGNPFFVEEGVKSLIAAGELAYVDGAWARRSEQSDPIGLSFIPRSVQDAVRQRADRLSAEAKQALTVAAVAGRRFDFTLLQQVLHCAEDRVLPLMKELIAAQLVVEESADQFAFRHALIREAIYSELLARERRSGHRTIAEALEVLYASPPERETHLADLAYHFYAAGCWTKALEYMHRAGDKALALYAPSAAIEQLTNAVDAAQQLHRTPPGKVYLARGQAYETRGEFDRARDDYERALEIARLAADGALEWQSMMALGLLWAGRDYAQAGAWFRQASDQAARLADPTLRARSLNRLGNWLANTGRIEEGLHAHQEALGIFEEQQDPRGIAETRDLLGPAHGMRGDRVKAVEELGKAIALFRTLGDRRSLVSSLAMRALQSMPGANETTFCPRRTRDECVRDATEALHLARQIDSLAGQAFTENALAHTLLSFGEFGPALTHAQEAGRIAGEIGHQQWRVANAYGLGRSYLLLLASAPAIAALEAGLALAQELGSKFWIATLAANLGRAYIVNHDLSAAQATLETVMPGALREQHPRNVAERDVALAWGELALAQGAPGVARQVAEHLLASVPGADPGPPGPAGPPIPPLLRLKGEALLALAVPARRSGPVLDPAHLDEAVAALEGAKRGAQEQNARPGLWMVHRALGQAYQLLQRPDLARQEIAAARQLIQELAATLDAALEDQAALADRFARAALDSLPPAAPPRPREAARDARQAFRGLTTREREVAALIAQGKTSREIANILVIQERTAEVHVSNILRKLDFTSRAQIAVWAVESGLAPR